MKIHKETRMDITGIPYVLSHQDNTVIVLGCGSFAYMAGLTVSNLNVFHGTLTIYSSAS
jgi:hypothetical protein